MIIYDNSNFIGIVLIGFGIALVVINSNIIEVSQQYDNHCNAPIVGSTNNNCAITINIPTTMQAPVFFYYELHNFYQNHRRYIKSRSTSQLAGSNLPVSSISSDCDPVVLNSDLNVLLAMDNKTPLVPSAPANPCGLIAKSLFNGKLN